MDFVYAVFDDSGEDGESNLLSVHRSQKGAEVAVQKLIDDNEGEWKKTGERPGISARWECDCHWIAWERFNLRD